jgi:hypothetical protein
VRTSRTGIIERSCIEGQKAYHIELEKAMRAYIHQHRSEFLEEGQDTSPDSYEEEDSEFVRGRKLSATESSDTFKEELEAFEKPEGWIKSLIRSFPILEELRHGLCGWFKEMKLEGMMPITIGFIVVGLIVSNLWTLNRPPSHHRLSALTDTVRLQQAQLASVNQAAGGGGGGGSGKTPDEIASAVRGVLQDYFAGLNSNSPSSPTAISSPIIAVAAADVPIASTLSDKIQTVEEINEVLDQLELRIKKLRKELTFVEVD